MAMRISSRQTPGSRVEYFERNETITMAVQNAVDDRASPIVAEFDFAPFEPYIAPSSLQIGLDAADEFLVRVMTVAEKDAQRLMDAHSKHIGSMSKKWELASPTPARSSGRHRPFSLPFFGPKFGEDFPGQETGQRQPLFGQNFAQNFGLLLAKNLATVSVSVV